MNINNCFTFVFVKATEEAARSIPTSPTVCRVCLQDFENKESLEQHMRTPALPVGDASAHHCSVCRRAFGSSRALDQHMKSCQKPAKPLKESSGYSEVLREGFSGNVVRMDVPITSEAGLRLSHLARQSDKLRRLLPSKAAVKRAIGRGELVLNGEHVEETRILKAGDLVTLCLDRVREALDATTARARNVKMVLPRESPTAPGDGWQVLRSVCPDGVVVVWKPTGMRSLGFHAGTLQSSLPLLPELAALGASRFQPFSRLEIGCCGLSLAARSCLASRASLCIKSGSKSVMAPEQGSRDRRGATALDWRAPARVWMCSLRIDPHFHRRRGWLQGALFTHFAQYCTGGTLSVRDLHPW